jgi:formylglycine-generating enzyme required for sulfatase activity
MEICSSGTCVEAPDGYVVVESGEFYMGTFDGEVGRDTLRGLSEGPRHAVIISRDLLVKETEVTVGEWRDIAGSNPAFAAGPSWPVERVSWWDAVRFANAASEAAQLEACYSLEGCTQGWGGGCDDGEGSCIGDYECEEIEFVGLDCEGFRLPTEAEWEYFARAGTETPFYDGSDAEGNCPWSREAAIGWTLGCPQFSRSTRSVGGLIENDWGVYDTVGNVWEHVWDAGDDGYYERSPPEDPLGGEESGTRVIRGGSASNLFHLARSGERSAESPASRSSSTGFRLVRSLP